MQINFHTLWRWRRLLTIRDAYIFGSDYVYGFDDLYSREVSNALKNVPWLFAW